jgi:hypothetical protein
MDTNLDELTLPSGFGAPSSSGVKFEYFKLKQEDDSMCLRILPSMKGLLNRRDVGIFRKLHYGWQGRNPNDPGKTSHRPFLCIEEKRNGMIVKECPACKLRNEYFKKFEAVKAQKVAEADRVKAAAKTQGVVDENKISAAIAKKTETFDTQMKPITEWLKTHGVDGKFTFYAINKTGQLGIGMIPYGLKKKLTDVIKQIEAKPYPASITKGREIPTQANGKVGIYFDFIRSGKASSTSDTVSVHMVPFGDEGGMKVDYHIVSNDVLKQAYDVLPCLVEEVESLRLSDDKVERLVKHCIEFGGSCDPDTVDEIMGSRNRTAPAVEVPLANEAVVATGPFTRPTVPAEPSVAIFKAEEVQVVKTSPVGPVPQKAPAPAVENCADATDEQFEALFG